MQQARLPLHLVESSPTYCKIAHFSTSYGHDRDSDSWGRHRRAHQTMRPLQAGKSEEVAWRVIDSMGPAGRGLHWACSPMISAILSYKVSFDGLINLNGDILDLLKPPDPIAWCALRGRSFDATSPMESHRALHLRSNKSPDIDFFRPDPEAIKLTLLEHFARRPLCPPSLCTLLSQLRKTL